MWIESHLSLRLHPKRRKLSRLLDIGTAQTVGHLMCLWWWAFEHAGDDGDIERWELGDIADGAEWTGDPGKFVTALVDSGFVDPNPLTIHDWPDFIGKLIERRVRNRDRMRDARAKVCKTRATHVPKCVRLPDRTGPDLTRPDLTGPDRTTPKPPQAGGVEIPYQDVIDDLNAQLKPEHPYLLNDSIRKNISGRFSEGHTLEDFKEVHRKQVIRWKGTDMEKYLRPATLYLPSKFPGYLSTPLNLSDGNRFSPKGAAAVNTIGEWLKEKEASDGKK